MFERSVRMPATWPDGTPRSGANAFSGAYLVRGAAAVSTPPARRGPKVRLAPNPLRGPRAPQKGFL